MSKKKSKKGKPFSGLRGFPLIPPNKVHKGRRRKKGPYNRRKFKEEPLYED